MAGHIHLLCTLWLFSPSPPPTSALLLLEVITAFVAWAALSTQLIHLRAPNLPFVVSQNLSLSPYKGSAEQLDRSMRFPRVLSFPPCPLVGESAGCVCVTA